LPTPSDADGDGLGRVLEGLGWTRVGWTVVRAWAIGAEDSDSHTTTMCWCCSLVTLL